MGFADDVTPRYILEYNNAGLRHHVKVRLQTGTDQTTGVAAARLVLNQVFTDLAGFLCTDLAFIGAVWIDQDSTLAIPVATPTAVTGLVSLSSYSHQDQISSFGFSGRGLAGGRFRLYVFGIALSPDTPAPGAPGWEFVFHAGGNGAVDAAVGHLAGAPLLAAGDGTKPFIRTDVTLKVNDHWLKKVRSGGV